VSPMRYELGFYIPEDGILHDTAVKASNIRTKRPVRRVRSLKVEADCLCPECVESYSVPRHFRKSFLYIACINWAHEPYNCFRLLYL
jgi:hypothetical protein